MFWIFPGWHVRRIKVSVKPGEAQPAYWVPPLRSCGQADGRKESAANSDGQPKDGADQEPRPAQHRLDSETDKYQGKSENDDAGKKTTSDHGR